MSKSKVEAIVVSQVALATDVYSLVVSAPAIVKEAVPGQFAAIYCNDGSRLLPRPISICEIDRENENLRFVYRVVGKGTEELAKRIAGETISVMGPLGNGFTLMDKKAMLIAGGIGIPPMLQLAKELHCEKNVVLGYRDEVFMQEEFAQYGDVYIASEDGKHGVKGNVMNAIEAAALDAEVIYACGPKPMLRAIKEYGLSHGMITQISMEEKMACGIGACLACVCKSTEVDGHSYVHNKRVCKDGPVFFAEEVDLS